MHATLTTGEIISKDEAGRRAAEQFAEHVAILGVALAHLRGQGVPAAPPRQEWRPRTVACMREIIAASERSADR